MSVAFDAFSASGLLTDTNLSWSFTHTPVGTPKGVVVYTFTDVLTPSNVTGVTYGGVAMTNVGSAVDSAGEPGTCLAWFLGSGIPTGVQSVVATVDVGNGNNHAGVAVSVTASGNTSSTGVVTEADDQALTEENINDGSPGSASLRFAGVFSGISTGATIGASSTMIQQYTGVTGGRSFQVCRETTPGQGSRPVGFTGVSDDVAAVYLAVREVVYTVVNGTQVQLVNINADGTDVDAMTYKAGVALTEAEVATVAATPGVFVSGATSLQRRLMLEHVVQAQPFVLTNIPGLQFWFDADDASTFTFGSGTAVATWADKSGNSRNMDQTTAIWQPTRNGSQNGLTTVVFDGVNDNVRMSTLYSLAQPTTTFLALKNTAVAPSDGRAFRGGLDSPISAWAWVQKWAMYAGTVLTSAVDVDTAWHQVSCVFNGASSALYLDGTSIASGNAGSTGGSGPWSLSTDNQPWAGEIAEVILFDSILSAENQRAVERYLRAKWGTP